MKEYRKEELRNYVIGNVLFIITLSGIFDSVFDNNINDITDIIHLLFESALLSSIIYIYIYIVDSMIPYFIKEKIALFPINKPGSVVFKSIVKKKKGYNDDRFTIDEVKDKYKDILKEVEKTEKAINKEYNQKKKNDLKRDIKKYQNSKWFSIYIKHKDDNAVFTTQKDFLLNRDMNVITLSIAAIYLIICLFSDTIIFKWSVIILLIAEYIATSIAAKLKAIRFVLTVVSRDIHVDK
ncbi:hypothetical protein [Ruminococcus flavefaciens]|uniref:hypothetical protein n=1 Tax=Ruminococcus flavefaciens TaxID=1265 RepID=UPI0026E9A26F|nr:hypothetical protein [Ruminococcus flavefaciens]